MSSFRPPTDALSTGRAIHTSPKRKRGVQWEILLNPSLVRRAAAVTAMLLMAGCIGRRGNIELLEAHLRRHQDLLDRQQRALAETRDELNRARQEADLLREQMANAGASPLPAEYTATLFQAQDIQFNTLLTGGRDEDGVSGDELLVVVFAPYDADGGVVKLPGQIEVEAIDPHRTEAEGRQLARWTFAPEESRELWRASLIGAGFHLRLVWPEPPEAEEVLLHARLSTADGRHFDASHTIAIAPAGDQSPGSFPAPEVIRPVNYNRDTSPSHADRRPFAVRSTPEAPLEDILDMAKPPDESRPARPGFEPVLRDPGADGASDGESTRGGADPESNGDQQPRPFPDGLRTSDVWTDETIPRLR